MEDIIVTIDGKEHSVKIEEGNYGKIKVHLNGETYEVGIKDGSEDTVEKKKTDKDKQKEINSPIPGTIVKIYVKKKDKVKEGDPLVKIVAMKMENDILSKKDGVIKEVKVKKGDIVNKGDILILFK